MVEENWVEENRTIKHSLSWKKHFKCIKTYRLMIYANTLPKIPTEMTVIPVYKRNMDIPSCLSKEGQFLE